MDTETMQSERRWPFGRNLHEVEPSAVDLQEFLLWLKWVKKVEVGVRYPGVSVTLVFQLYREEYLAADPGWIVSESPRRTTGMYTGWRKW